MDDNEQTIFHGLSDYDKTLFTVRMQRVWN